MGVTPLVHACVCAYVALHPLTHTQKHEKVALHPLTHTQTRKGGVLPINTHTSEEKWRYTHVLMDVTPLFHVCVCVYGCNATFSRLCVLMDVTPPF
jgi:L-cystine uptake protein TcyP (sodium:dicarboxylate symporter family)